MAFALLVCLYQWLLSNQELKLETTDCDSGQPSQFLWCLFQFCGVHQLISWQTPMIFTNMDTMKIIIRKEQQDHRPYWATIQVLFSYWLSLQISKRKWRSVTKLERDCYKENPWYTLVSGGCISEYDKEEEEERKKEEEEDRINRVLELGSEGRGREVRSFTTGECPARVSDSYIRK